MRFGSTARRGLAVALACLGTHAAPAGAVAVNNTSCGSGWSTNGVCKYTQDKITWSCTSYSSTGRCAGGTLHTTRWRAATATGSCNVPYASTNDIKQWRIVSLHIYTSSGRHIAYKSAGVWHTNCELREYAWGWELPTREDLVFDYVFEHQRFNGSNFITQDRVMLVLGQL